MDTANHSIPFQNPHPGPSPAFFAPYHFLLTVIVLSSLPVLSSLLEKYRFSLFSHHSKCAPVRHASNPFPLPWSLNRKYEVYRASVRGDLFEGHFTRKYTKYGKTHAIVSPLTGLQKGINTIEPENIRCVLATKFGDYKRPEFRSLAAQPMLLPGLFTTDGPIWSHWRGMVRPQFTRRRFDKNVAESERHMQLLFRALEGKSGCNTGGWTEEVDMMDHMYRLTMDTATQFLFGSSAETQTAALARSGILPREEETYQEAHLDGFDQTFIKAGGYVGHRMKLSNMYWIYDGWEFRRACTDLYRMVDGYVSFVRKKGREERGGIEIAEKPETVIEEMEAQGASQKDMVEQTMHLLVAGMDTSAAALGWVFAMLGAHPDKYAKLREEVIKVFGTEERRSETEFSLESVKTCEYLQWCLRETLRLFPAGPINVREAVRDTVLPVGGGEDGMSPVAVRKGARVQLGTYLT
jgi:cytochrome P450